MSYCQSCANLERALAEETERSSRATTLLEDERRRYRFQIKRAEKAEADLARLTEENEALRKDAERYRWLRDNNDPELWDELADINEGPSTDEQADLGASAAWDAAIDAAIKEGS